MTAVRSVWVMGAVGCCLLAAPAQANTLLNWRFIGNRLEFRTALPTQPQVQILSDPPRIVVDLPGTVLGRPPERQDIPQTWGRESPVRQVRLGQFDPQTTRLVVELYPDYVLTPEHIQPRRMGGNQWVIALPSTLARMPSPEMATQAAVLEGVQVTEMGLALRLRGNTAAVQVRRSPDRQEIWVDIPASLAPQFQTELLNLAHLGVLRFQAQPLAGNPAVSRLTLYVDSQSPDWQATFQGNDILLLPQKPSYGPEAVTAPVLPRLRPGTTLIERVEWDAAHQQVLIRANRPLTYSQRWEREPGLSFASLRLVLESVRLSPQAEQGLKQLSGLEVAVETVGQQVHLLWRPSPEMRVIGIQELGPHLLAVQLLPAAAPTATLSPLARWLNRRSGATPPVAVPRPGYPTWNPPQPTPGRAVVVLDPGHGGPDPGAIGIGGLREKDVVMDIARQVAALLEQQGVQVVLTRTADVDLGLEPRVALARRVNATLFISIHANALSLSRPDVNGIETYYFYPASYGLAWELHRAMVQASGAPDRGVRQARFYVIRHTPADMPSVLLEVGYVTGATDAARLASAEGRRAMAQAIAQGIGRYLRVRR